MRLLHRPMWPKDVKNCAALLASHPEERRRYGDVLKRVAEAWLALLRCRCVQAMVLEDQDWTPARLVSCGISVFVTDEFVCELKAGPLRWVGPELTQRALRGAPCFLRPDAVRKANSDGGLNLLVWVGLACPTKPEDFNAVAMEVIRAFSEIHEGYWLKEILTQPNEIGPIRFTLNGGMTLWDPVAANYTDGFPALDEKFFQNPFLLGKTRDAALAQLGNRTSILFANRRPKIFFWPSEQRLLLAALRGLTDEELADELTISLSAVKKTWRAIYRRASWTLPDTLRADKSSDACDSKRGKEKKQRLLSYLRDHREELRPVLQNGDAPRTQPAEGNCTGG
jgi:hypothetical protein